MTMAKSEHYKGHSFAQVYVCKHGIYQKVVDSSVSASTHCITARAHRGIFNPVFCQAFIIRPFSQVCLFLIYKTNSIYLMQNMLFCDYPQNILSLVRRKLCILKNPTEIILCIPLKIYFFNWHVIAHSQHNWSVELEH